MQAASSASSWLSYVPVITLFVIPASFWMIQEQFSKRYPSIDRFNTLDEKLAKLSKTFESADYATRTSLDKEVIRIHEEFIAVVKRLENANAMADTNAQNRSAEIRGMIRDVEKTLAAMEKENIDAKHRFDMYKQELEFRLKVLEDEHEDRKKA